VLERKGRLRSAARSDWRSDGATAAATPGRSRVPLKVTSRPRPLTTPNRMPFSQTRPAFSGRKAPTMAQGTVKAAKPPRMENAMRYAVREVRSS